MQVDSEWSRGNHQGAHDASRMARGWGLAGIITGILIIVVCVVVFIVVPVLALGATASTASSDDY